MNNSPKAKGIRTSVQAFIGFAVTFIVGLVTVVWAVPGVPEAVSGYLLSQLVPILVFFGIPVGAASGIAAYLWNKK